MPRTAIFYFVFTTIVNLALSQEKCSPAVPILSSYQKSGAVLETLQTRLQQESQKDSVGSISCAVVIGSQIIFEKGFGALDKEHSVQVSPETIYMIGSISKSITAIALMRLVDKNIMGLDDPVEMYLPEINKLVGIEGNVQDMTIGHLATHTSGLAMEPELIDSNKGPFEIWENKLLEAIPTTYLKTNPGEEFNYSNIGYGILGLAMCRAANKSFDEILKDEVFIPLQMKNSFLSLTLAEQKDLARSYKGTRDYKLGRGYKFPNGGIYSTAHDIANLIKAILDTDFQGYLTDLSRSELFKIHAEDYDNKDEASGYGIGLNIWTDKFDHKLAMHGGIVAPGYSASLFCDLKTKIGIVMLRNDFGKPDIMELADEFLWKLNRIE